MIENTNIASACETNASTCEATASTCETYLADMNKNQGGLRPITTPLAYRI